MQNSWQREYRLSRTFSSSMYSEGQVIYLDEAWDQTIKKKALEPLEDMLEKGVEKKKQLFNNTEYIAIYS